MITLAVLQQQIEQILRPLGETASFTIRAVPVPHDMQIAPFGLDDLYIPIQGQKLLKDFKYLFIRQHRSLNSFLTSF